MICNPNIIYDENKSIKAKIVVKGTTFDSYSKSIEGQTEIFWITVEICYIEIVLY